MDEAACRHLVGPRKYHRQHLSHAPDDDLDFLMPTKRAGERRTQNANHDLRMPATTALSSTRSVPVGVSEQ